MKPVKTTTQLLDELRRGLLIRRDYIWDIEDKLEQMFSNDKNGLISIQNAHSMEIDRIESIFKLLEKGKI